MQQNTTTRLQSSGFVGLPNLFKFAAPDTVIDTFRV